MTQGNNNNFQAGLEALNDIVYWFSPKACFIWAVIGICLHKCGFSLSKYFHSALALSLGQPSCCSAMWAPIIGFCQYSWLHTAQTNGFIFTWWYMQWSYRIFFWWKALSGHRVHLNLFSLFFTLMLNFILDKPCGENHLLKCKTVDMLLWRPTRKQIMVLCFISKLLICSTLVWTWAKFLGFDSKLLLFQGIFSITLFMNKNILKATSPKSLQNIDQSHGSLDNSLMFTHNVIIETTHICDFGGISKQQQKQ